MDIAVKPRNGEYGTAAEMIDVIIDTHHAFTRTQLKKIARLLSETAIDQHETLLSSLKEFCRILHNDLTSHMEKEEAGLFPYIKELEKAVCSRTVPTMPKFVSVKHPIRMFITEHKETYNIIKRIRSLTDNYTPFANADDRLRELYAALEAVEADLKAHMHLEDDRLFILAAGLEELCIAQANSNS